MPGQDKLCKSFYFNRLRNLERRSKSDLSRFELPEPLHSAMAVCRRLRPDARLAQLRFQPVPTRSDVHDEGDGQLRGVLHLLSHEVCDCLHFGPRHFEDQFVVHL